MRQRGTRDVPKKAAAAVQEATDIDIPELKEQIQSSITSEWDYKLALAVITLGAFITRFWGIGHPNEVVFDEVHFGKVAQLPHNHPSSVLIEM